ncbi:MAG: diguanylate cyclase (GGDEF)-like protein [Gammaproteobacteria bacterium]
MKEATQITGITNLGLAIQVMPAIVFHVDNKGLYQFASKEILQKMGEKVSDLSTPLFRAADLGKEVVQGCIGNQPLSSLTEVNEFDLQAVLPDQQIMHIKLRILPLADEIDQDSGTLIFCYNNSNQKRIEQELDQKALTLELLLACAHIANSSVAFKAAVISSLDKICSYHNWLYSGWLISHAYLVDENNPDRLLPSDIWSIQSREGLDPFINLTMNTELMIGEGVPGKVLATGKPIWSGRSAKDSPYPRARIADECGLLSVVAIPVSNGEKVIAVLEFFAAEERRPDNQLLDILMSIGEQLGMVYERESVNRKLQFLADHDSLTGLVTIGVTKDRIDQACARAYRNKQIAAILFVDLDGFKIVNDEHGHDVGDALLKQVALILKNSIRDVDTAARIGGDEFLVILSDLESDNGVIRVARALNENLSEISSVEGKTVKIGASIGISVSRSENWNVEALIREADEAMYKAKKAGKNCYYLASWTNKRLTVI